MIRPLSDWILVRLDKFEENRGSIIILEDSSANPILTGTVEAVGPGRKIEDRKAPVGVEKGEKVAFLRWHLEHKSGKQRSSFLSDLGEDLALIRAADVLFAFSASEGVRIG